MNYPEALLGIGIAVSVAWVLTRLIQMVELLSEVDRGDNR